MVNFVDELADPASYLPAPPTGVTQQSRGTRGRSNFGGVAPIVDFITAKGYTFEPWQIAAYVAAIRTKPFVILAGISGTGKTRLPRLVAEATNAPQPQVIPVRPDWTDSSDLLGYVDLGGAFVPGHLLRACKQAMEDPDTQFFFVLDEMNVARVEYYFAEVLSLMENRFRRDGRIISDPLYPHAPVLPSPPAKTTVDSASILRAGLDAEVDDIPRRSVYLPPNLAIVGTVNMDETTHGFSRKVLDRAFVIELTEVNLEDFGTPAEDLDAPLKWTAKDWAGQALRLAESDLQDDPIVSDVVKVLVNANEALRLAQLQVAYRVRDEAALFCVTASSDIGSFIDSTGTPVTPLDLVVGMKVLPRIQGGGTMVANVLNGLKRWMAPTPHDAPDSDEAEDGADLKSGEVRFPRSLERINLMLEQLTHTGFTSYWV